jgi:methyl coenzyme M reductase subunit C-like uncharacterized protein (methanogenesis marker protein 7)
MNIDERLEALRQFVQSLASMRKDREREFAEQKPLVIGAAESLAETNRQLAENNRILVQMIASLDQGHQELSGDSREWRDAITRLSVLSDRTRLDA